MGPPARSNAQLRQLTLHTKSVASTRYLGERIGRMLEAGDVVLLSGELGAGKTVLAQGIGRGMGISDPIKSSSFVIMNEYQGPRLRLFHADLYRLEDPEQVAELALEELALDGVLVIEWPERAPDELPEQHLLLRFAYEPGTATARTIEVEPHGELYEDLAERLRPRR